jgi:hypothetical protein
MTIKDKIDRENLRRWQAESDIYAGLELLSSGLELQRIDITGDRNNHNHDGIKNNTYYLIAIDGNWYISKASKQIWGWNFYGAGGGGVSLRNCDFIFEILNMPTYEKYPLGREKYPHEDEDDY